jgi:hypothetical protein
VQRIVQARGVLQPALCDVTYACVLVAAERTVTYTFNVGGRKRSRVVMYVFIVHCHQTTGPSHLATAAEIYLLTKAKC